MEYFMRENSCFLKQHKEGTVIYGKINLIDAIHGTYKITRIDQTFIVYQTVDQLLEDGWVIT